ncbi:MAG TPA: hypothetical protein VH165_32545, partial [Kofleriaceae bacterium]|nr:hypothetical protein [Kofleriaceae bacterium]
MRGALILFVLATTVTAAVAAPRAARKPKHGRAAEPAAAIVPVVAPVPAAPAAPASPDDAKATAILDRIVAGPDTAARKAAIAELTAIAPGTVGAIGSWLGRTHQTEIADRRAVLTSIKASVPDKTGKFTQPARQTGKEQKADDDIDWLTDLLAIDPTTGSAAGSTASATTGSAAGSTSGSATGPAAGPAAGSTSGPTALGEVIADDAAIRALAQTKDPRAGQQLFDAAFGDATMIYRDECGRYLRKMEPASIPALTLESQGKDADRKRYATWQLERLDRQEPGKALDAALGDEALTLAILDVFRTTHHREAVHAVWHRVNADS